MIIKTTETVSAKLTVVSTSGSSKKSGLAETEKSVDQKVQDEINLSRSGQLIDRLRTLSDGDDFADALAKGSDEIKELTDAFEQRWKANSPNGAFDRNAYQDAIRQTVEDILNGPHPATQKAEGKTVMSFYARVSQKIEIAL